MYNGAIRREREQWRRPRLLRPRNDGQDGPVGSINPAAGRTDFAKATPAPASPALIEDLVAANRVLSSEGLVDGFGHVSVRHDSAAGVFLLARSMAPGLVTALDIMQFGEDGEALGNDRRTAY